jgi:hypothetical protein
MKDSQIGGEIPKVEEPSSPNMTRTTSHAPKSPNLGQTKNSPSLVKAQTPWNTSPAKVNPSSSAVGTHPSAELTESPKTTPPSPQSHGLGSADGVPLSGDSSSLN